jgi:hypothetical protein
MDPTRLIRTRPTRGISQSRGFEGTVRAAAINIIDKLMLYAIRLIIACFMLNTELFILNPNFLVVAGKGLTGKNLKEAIHQ